jgi:hypothetical protein
MGGSVHYLRPTFSDYLFARHNYGPAVFIEVNDIPLMEMLNGFVDAIVNLKHSSSLISGLLAARARLKLRPWLRKNTLRKSLEHLKAKSVGSRKCSATID